MCGCKSVEKWTVTRGCYEIFGMMENQFKTFLNTELKYNILESFWITPQKLIRFHLRLMDMITVRMLWQNK